MSAKRDVGKRLLDRKVDRVPTPAHGAKLVAIAAEARAFHAGRQRNRPIDGDDHVGHRNRGQGSQQAVAATRAPLRRDQSPSRKRLEYLGYGRLGNTRRTRNARRRLHGLAARQPHEHDHGVVGQLRQPQHRTHQKL